MATLLSRLSSEFSIFHDVSRSNVEFFEACDRGYVTVAFEC